MGWRPGPRRPGFPSANLWGPASPPACWGEDDYGQARPPEGEFASVSAGGDHTCGVKTGGAVACWGDNEHGQARPPEGEFASVSAGANHTCGVKTGGSVACWGHNDDGQAKPPKAEFASVSAGGYHTCGVPGNHLPLQEDWGAPSSAGALIIMAKPGRPKPTYHTCGVRVGGSVACWGGDNYGQATPHGGEFASVSAGTYHTCGVRVGGSVACWGGIIMAKPRRPEGNSPRSTSGASTTAG